MILTDNNFEEMINSERVVLVDFWAEWCNPCKMVSPILDELNKEFQLPIAKLNVDENIKKTKEYGIGSIPTIILFVDGKPVNTIVGAKPKHVLIKELQDWI
jgi:thioredoxin 1